MKTKTRYKVLLSLLFFTIQINAQEIIISKSELPTKAQSFLNQHFTKNKINYILKETHFFSTDYKVKLVNGTKIEFDKEGDWNEIEGKHNPLPTTFIPADIIKYVKEKFPDNTINEIDKNYWNYEIQLSNGLELTFNTKGNFVKIDD